MTLRPEAGFRPEVVGPTGGAGLRVLMVSLHTSPVDLPGSGNAGGMNTYVLQTAHSLAVLGVRVELVTGTTGPGRSRAVDTGVHLHEVPARAARDPAAKAAAAVEFGSAVLTAVGRCDVVHGHYWLSGLAAQRIGAAWGAAFVQSSHTLAAVKSHALHDPGSEPAVRVAAETGFARTADRLVANTDVEAAQLVRWCAADPERVSVVEPGVDLAVFRPADRGDTGWRTTRRDLGISPDEPVVAYIGRLQPLKAPDVVIAAAGPLLELLVRAGHPPRVTVVVCGAPAGRAEGEMERLRALAAAAPRGVTIRFLEPRPAPALAELYRAVDVVAVPSRSESFGLVALEAQASGTPVLAASVGGLPRAVATASSLVDGHDPRDWAAALAWLLTDRDGRGAAVAAGLAYASGFSWDRTARGLLAVYRRALADRADRS